MPSTWSTTAKSLLSVSLCLLSFLLCCGELNGFDLCYRIGAGGIGCELLKNLVLCGFRKIETIDLDTIDVSNLNRQFLFRKKHVGKSKSEVAKSAAMAFNPDAEIVAYLGNVKEERFGIKFFKTFDLVLNALDNVNARQHVNRLCLAAKIPLIDAGTTGYLGQVTVIQAGETKCYDCEPKSENKKTFPICTIRNTPDKPVHCIVWGKELFKLMFGDMHESMLSAVEEEEEEGASAGKEGKEEEGEGKDAARQKEDEIRSMIMTAVKRPDESDPAAVSKEALEKYAKTVFDAVFDKEIQLKLKLRDGYKGAKYKPAPITFEDVMSGKVAEDEATNGAAQSAPAAIADQRVWSLKECCQAFVDAVVKIWNRGSIGSLSFDKDDALALDFVTAASNLRSHIFSIERKSRFDVKGIAGNIIHAIATTNAIVAGLQVLEAVKVLINKQKASASKEKEKESITEGCKFTWVVRDPVGSGNLLQPTALEKPNPKCYSCGNAQLNLAVDSGVFTLRELVEKVIKKGMGVNAPSVMIGASELYMEGEGLDEEEIEAFKKNLPKTLQGCPAGGIKDGSIVEIEDFSQDLSFKFIIQHLDGKDIDKDKYPDRYIISGEKPVAKEEVQVPKEKEDEKENVEKMNDTKKEKQTRKRQREDDDVEVLLQDVPANAKKSKLEKPPASVPEPQEVIEID